MVYKPCMCGSGLFRYEVHTQAGGFGMYCCDECLYRRTKKNELIRLLPWQQEIFDNHAAQLAALSKLEVAIGQA